MQFLIVGLYYLFSKLEQQEELKDDRTTLEHIYRNLESDRKD